ncbi:MAG: prepilin-type N-terminal cleavage/methylation domain-containing protein [Bacilli bacterium]|nr:prepilin-type N-terminal cleavage/methylation domain-containing protein [Bacilli bacterium]
MKNNKGFTIVELLASFVLSMIIVVIMFQLIINLKDLYQVSALKSELSSQQSILTNKIYSDLTNKKMTMINEHDEKDSSDNIIKTYIGFSFNDGSATELIIDKVNKYLTYDNYTIKLNDLSDFGNIEINTKETGAEIGYNGLLSINIPINNRQFSQENFGINIVYPYNRYEITSETIDTENGYASDGLIVRLDAINNTGSGHASNITEWADLSGNGNNATLYNNPLINNNSVIFNGQTNYGLINNTAGMEFTEGITMEARVKILSLTGLTSINTIEFFGNWENAGGGLYYKGDNHFGYSLYVNGGYQYVGNNSNSNLGEYYNISMTYNNLSQKLYINGIKVSEKNTTEQYPISPSHMAFGIGCNPNSSSAHYFANAEFQSVRIYNRALTDEEVLNNYQIDNFRY